MKKWILLSAAMVSSMMSFAQLEQGSLMVGGGIGFTSNNRTTEVTMGSTTITNKLPSTNTFTFEPRIGYFLADRFAVGLYAGIGSSKVSAVEINGITERTTTLRQNPITVGVFARKYFMPLETVGFYAGAYAGIKAGKIKLEWVDRNTVTGETTTTTPDPTKLSGFEAGVQGGVVWFPHPRFSVETGLALLNFNSDVSKTSTTKDTRNSFGVMGSGNNLNLTFSYFF